MLTVVVGRLWRRRVGEVSEVERVGGSVTSVGIDEEHVLRWVLRRVSVGYVVWIHKVKCLQPFSGGRDF